MKTTFFVLFVLTGTMLFAQEANCDSLTMVEAEDYAKIEPCIAKLCDLVLDRPLVGDEEANDAQSTIITWMSGTPDYTFSLYSGVLKCFKGDNLLLMGSYMTAMSKVAIDGSEDIAKDAIGVLVEYIRNPDHEVRLNKSLKKLIKAWDAHDVSKYLE